VTRFPATCKHFVQPNLAFLAQALLERQDQMEQAKEIIVKNPSLLPRRRCGMAARLLSD
jgi:hypothetical protein